MAQHVNQANVFYTQLAEFQGQVLQEFQRVRDPRATIDQRIALASGLLRAMQDRVQYFRQCHYELGVTTVEGWMPRVHKQIKELMAEQQVNARFKLVKQLALTNLGKVSLYVEVMDEKGAPTCEDVVIKFSQYDKCAPKVPKATENPTAESRALQFVNHDMHPGFIGFRGFFGGLEGFYLATDFAHQGDLYHAVSGSPVDMERSKRWFRELLQSVVYMHNNLGIVHLDLKPENVLISWSGKLKIADLGVTAVLQPGNIAVNNEKDAAILSHLQRRAAVATQLFAGNPIINCRNSKSNTPDDGSGSGGSGSGNGNPSGSVELDSIHFENEGTLLTLMTLLNRMHTESRRHALEATSSSSSTSTTTTTTTTPEEVKTGMGIHSSGNILKVTPPPPEIMYELERDVEELMTSQVLTVTRELQLDSLPTAPMHRNVGTAAYQAPEIWPGTGYDGRLADVYSLGVILFILVTGYPPYTKPFERPPQYEAFRKYGVRKLLQAYGITLEEQLIRLLEVTLVMDPTKRLMPSQLLDHPWLATTRQTGQGVQAALAWVDQNRDQVHHVMALMGMNMNNPSTTGPGTVGIGVGVEGIGMTGSGTMSMMTGTSGTMDVMNSMSGGSSSSSSGSSSSGGGSSSSGMAASSGTYGQMTSTSVYGGGVGNSGSQSIPNGSINHGVGGNVSGGIGGGGGGGGMVQPTDPMQQLQLIMTMLSRPQQLTQEQIAYLQQEQTRLQQLIMLQQQQQQQQQHQHQQQQQQMMMQQQQQQQYNMYQGTAQNHSNNNNNNHTTTPMSGGYYPYNPGSSPSNNQGGMSDT